MISPYAKRGYIDHQTLSFDAYLKFIEDSSSAAQRLDPRTDGRPDPRPYVREDVPILGDLAQEFDFDAEAAAAADPRSVAARLAQHSYSRPMRRWSARSGRGAHQFQSPSSRISEGMSSARTIVASTSTAKPIPMPSCFTKTISRRARTSTPRRRRAVRRR